MNRALSALLLGLAALLAACSAPPEGKGGSGKGPMVLAAASLQESLEAVADEWASQGHARPVLSFAGSSALARQVEQGAPGDLFLSADEEWMDELEARGLLRPGTRATLLGNTLVLVAPALSKVAVSFADPAGFSAALGKGPLAMADPDAVPAGKYGKAALEKLGLWASVRSKVASAENVRAALALVESGEAPLGVVYATDAKASAKVRVVATFPEGSHPPILYPVAVLKGSTHADAAGFRAFLAGSEARAVFARYGFTAPE